MAKKERRATDDLNLALSGISAALTIMESLDDPAHVKKAIKEAEGHLSDAWAAFRAIRASAEKI